MNKKGNKIIASIAVFMLIMTHISTLGLHIGEVFAANANLNNQNSNTNNANVKFDSYFMNNENKTHEATKNIGEDNKIVAQVSVKNAGYLKNARIDFVDSNFKIGNQIESDKVVTINSENNAVILNQIDSNEDVTIELPITLEHMDSINVSEFSKNTEAHLTGVYVDNNGKEHNIKKEISLMLNWTANAEPELEANLLKYVPYDVKGEKGLILQMSLKSVVKDNLLPIKQNTIEVLVPEINGIAPKDVNVYHKESNIEFEKDNYNYDENSKILTIKTENVQKENGEISWKNAQVDEYIITYKYLEEVQNEIDIPVKANSKIETYSSNNKELTANYENTITLKEKIGDIVDFRVTADEKLSKGYMYANEVATNKVETTYKETVTASIGLAELVDRMIINKSSDNFISENKNYESNTYYKNVKINKQIVNKILGEEGVIEIYSGETLFTTINKETEADKEYIVELNLDNVTIKTSKPINSGELIFEFEKAIKAENAYNKEQIQKIESLNLAVNGIVENSNESIVDITSTTQIPFIEPALDAQIDINNTNLSTIVANENVELKATLKTNSIYNKLYENPTIVIDLPSYVETVNIKNVQLLFDNELKVENVELVQNENGTKQIVIKLSGTQTKYSIDSLAGGANIVITADITANKLTPNKEAQIKMTVINEKETVESYTTINFIAPTGIVTVNKISNYVDGAQLMALTNDEKATLEVTTTSKNATAEIQVINNYNNIINNVQILGRTLAKGTTEIDSENTLNNTFDAPMLGAINTNGIENVSIYYTENGEATKELQNEENGWTQDVADFSKIKSYLIILNDYTMNVGDSVKFTYDMQIPENLEYSQTVKSLYTVYFDNIQEEQIIHDRAKSRTLTLETGVAPNLEVNLSSYSEENSTVRKGQYIKFIANIKNTGTVDAKNVKLNITAPSGNIYNYIDEENNVIFTTDTEKIENLEEQLAATYSTKHTEFIQEDFTSAYVDSEEIEKSILIGELKAGESKKIEYEVKIENIEIFKTNLFTKKDEGTEPDDETKILELIYPEIIVNNQVRTIADDMQKEVLSNEYKLKAEDGNMTVTLKTDRTSDNVLVKGESLKYSARVAQTSKHDNTKNVVLTIQIPEGLDIKNTNVENLILSDEENIKIDSKVDIDKENNIVKFTIEEFPRGYEISCDVEVTVGDVLGIISPKAELTAEGEGTYYGNIISNKVSKLDFSISQTNLDNKYVKETEQITFEYKIQNISDVYSSNLVFESEIPEGMKVVSIETIVDGNSQIIKQEETDKITINKESFSDGQLMTIRITMEAGLLPSGTTLKQLSTYATISGKSFETKTSNVENFTVEYNEQAHKNNPDDPDDPNNPDIVNGRKVISGFAWLDENKDGQRNDNEPIIPEVEVRLLNKNTNSIVRDVDTNEEKITKTSSTGEYIFTNLEAGEYLVIFVYNTAKYDLTEYRKTGVSQSVNSDFINIQMDINGKTATVATSDTIVITNANARNIDLGLINSNKSKLRLDKYVSAVTLTYGNTVKRYEYNNEKLVKAEIPAKEISKATVIVEYKIAVTNEGAIANYVKKIVDYVPSGMKFNSELNRDWYQSSNGDLYNSSLSNVKLESGETKEVTLTLTKQMTDSNVGIINNNAEIYEVYNEAGIADKDSTAGNKVNGEDDMSAADVVIGIKTGDAIIYTIIISVSICVVIGISIYYIRKYVLRKI